LEKVAFQPGRSYAFINFEVDEDAIDAMRSLQGFPLAGNPLRIEFAKAVSVAKLILFVSFPADYMYIPQIFSSVRFYSFNEGHNIGLDINKQNSQQRNLGIHHTGNRFPRMIIDTVQSIEGSYSKHARYIYIQ